MNWRPKDWINPHSCLGSRTKNHKKYDAYENGADAILKAMFKLAKDSPTGTFTIDSHIINIFGDRVNE